MADEIIQSAATHAGSLVGGGALSAWLLKRLFSNFSERIAEISKTMKELDKRADERHERMISKLSKVDGRAEAAHDRLDDFLKRDTR